MLQEVSVMPGLKVSEILELFRSYYPNPLSMKELVSLTALTKEDLKTRAEKLSGGQKRRLSFALALAGNPELLIFDEPTVGMDTSSRHRFWQTIHGLADQGKRLYFQLIIYRKQMMPYSESYFLLTGALWQTTHQ